MRFGNLSHRSTTIVSDGVRKSMLLEAISNKSLKLLQRVLVCQTTTFRSDNEELSQNESYHTHTLHLQTYAQMLPNIATAGLL